jgi:hypothetical protein
MRQVSYLGGLVTALAFILAACGGAPADVVETPVGAQSPAEEAAVTGPNTVEPAAAVEEEAPVPTEEMLLPEEDSPAAELPADDEEPTADEGAEAGSSALPEEVPEEGAAVEQEAEPAEVVPEEVDSPAEAAEQEPVATEELVETPPGPTEAQQQLLDSLTIKGTPPELHNEIWLNSEPLKLANLRGQVVIVEFWTYG